MRYCLLFLMLISLGCSEPPPRNEIFAGCYKLKTITKPKHPVQPGEWREKYTEIHEPLQGYLDKRPPGATAQRSKLYVVRLGTFDAKGQQIFEDTKSYLSAFFQIPVEELKTINITNFPKKETRQNSFGLQLKTPIILDSILPSLMPDDAFAVIAFSLHDLYPGDDWNFVFGEASLERRVGVWSMARLGNYNLNDGEYTLCRQRTLNVAAHETGHIFGIKHCVLNECCMNGSISLQESDLQPAWLCWECLAKVCLNRNASPLAHVQDLLDFHYNTTHDKKQINYYNAALALLKQ